MLGVAVGKECKELVSLDNKKHVPAVRIVNLGRVDFDRGRTGVRIIPVEVRLRLEPSAVEVAVNPAVVLCGAPALADGIAVVRLE